jgi:uncharacterized protein
MQGASTAETTHSPGGRALPLGSPPSAAPSGFAGVSAIATKVALAEGSVPRFAVWQAEITRAASAASGFVSIEFIPTYAGSPEWQIVQRFGSPSALEAWRSGTERARRFADLTPMLASDHAAPVDEAAPDFHALSVVTEVITTIVHPGREAAFRAFAETVQAKQAAFPGYMGTLVQAPISEGLPYWTTLVRFATPAQLDAWLVSEDRRDLLAGSNPAAFAWKSHRMQSGFASWFAGMTDEAPPPAWKQTMLVLLVLFPVVMLEIRFLSPHLAAWPLAVATFIGNALSVALVSWPLMAIAISGLTWWLKPSPARRWRMEALGLATVLGLYAIEIIAFMLFY